MKITHTILALLAAGLLGPSAFGSGNGPQYLAMAQDGHGGYHFLYHQSTGQMDSTSVALVTSSGGVSSTMMTAQEGPLPDDGQTRFVIGTNQHGNANAAFIPLSSHFGPANQ